MSVINLLLGIWFIISPWLLGYSSGAAVWNQFIVGVIIVVLALGRLAAPSQRWMSTLAGIAALWAIIAPFILSYDTTAAYWNEVIVGIVVAILAFSNASIPAGAGGRMHHHHGV
jgi:hypothetical protein